MYWKQHFLSYIFEIYFFLIQDKYDFQKESTYREFALGFAYIIKNRSFSEHYIKER